jgi:hypothetical protein
VADVSEKACAVDVRFQQNRFYTPIDAVAHRKLLCPFFKKLFCRTIKMVDDYSNVNITVFVSRSLDSWGTRFLLKICNQYVDKVYDDSHAAGHSFCAVSGQKGIK